MELVLLIIIVASVITLIYITQKSKDLEKEDVVDTFDAMQQEKEKPSGPPQNTIYEFSSKAGKRLCPFCDGENSAGAKVCKICGRDI